MNREMMPIALFILYGNIGKYTQALQFYHQALALNYDLPQALNNIAVIYHSQGLSARNYIVSKSQKRAYNKQKDNKKAKIMTA